MKNKYAQLFGQVLLKALALLPSRGQNLLANFFSAIIWYGNTRVRNIVSTNIQICYPELDKAKQDKIAKASIHHIFRTGIEMPSIWQNPLDHTKSLFAGMPEQKLIDQALAKGKGLIIVTPHLGQWELMLIILAELYPCTLLCNNADDIIDIGINRSVREGRMKTGAKLVEATQGIKPLLAALKANQIVIIAPDQIPPGQKGRAFSNFFGEQVATMTLLPRLAKMTQAEMLSGFAQRLDNGRYEIQIRSVDPKMYSKDLEEITRAMNKTIENLVNEAPAQYLWTYKRFRCGPEGRRKIYG